MDLSWLFIVGNFIPKPQLMFWYSCCRSSTYVQTLALQIGMFRRSSFAKGMRQLLFCSECAPKVVVTPTEERHLSVRSQWNSLNGEKWTNVQGGNANVFVNW